MWLVVVAVLSHSIPCLLVVYSCHWAIRSKTPTPRSLAFQTVSASHGTCHWGWCKAETIHMIIVIWGIKFFPCISIIIIETLSIYYYREDIPTLLYYRGDLILNISYMYQGVDPGFEIGGCPNARVSARTFFFPVPHSLSSPQPGLSTLELWHYHHNGIMRWLKIRLEHKKLAPFSNWFSGLGGPPAPSLDPALCIGS